MMGTVGMAAVVWKLIGAGGFGGMAGYGSLKLKDPYGVKSRLGKVFKASKIAGGTNPKSPEYPVISNYEYFENIHRFTIELPAGLSRSDIQDKQEKIADFFKGEVFIYKKKGELIIDILTNQIEWELNFDEEEIINHLHPETLGFTLGQSRWGIERLDLAKMPHLLVGGFTGGGKSVCLRLILTMLFLTHTSDELQAYLIDLKGGIEFDLFENLPHIQSFATEEQDIGPILDEVLDEYENRLRIFKQHHVPDITEYRRLGFHLPNVIVVFDEFAEINPSEGSKRKDAQWGTDDNGKSISQSDYRHELQAKVSRILRLARATGIHFIIATQRPDKDALPGQLKGNIPITIAFRVRNQVNSEILLDTDSAYKLDSTPGRAILKIGAGEKEIQVMNMPLRKARELLHETYGVFEVETE